MGPRACITLGVAGQAFCGNAEYVSRLDQSVFDNVTSFCHLRKSGVNGAHDPPDYFKQRSRPCSANMIVCTIQLFMNYAIYASIDVTY